LQSLPITSRKANRVIAGSAIFLRPGLKGIAPKGNCHESRKALALCCSRGAAALDATPQGTETGYVYGHTVWRDDVDAAPEGYRTVRTPEPRPSGHRRSRLQQLHPPAPVLFHLLRASMWSHRPMLPQRHQAHGGASYVIQRP